MSDYNASGAAEVSRYKINPHRRTHLLSFYSMSIFGEKIEFAPQKFAIEIQFLLFSHEIFTL